MIVDGKKIAGEILARASTRAAKLSKPPLVVALVGEETVATKSYLKIKEARAADAGCAFEARPLGSSVEDADAVIVQLPLPEGTDTEAILNAIPVGKDADVLSRTARTNGGLLPPVVGAIAEILKGIDVEAKWAVVIGRGRLVGEPAAAWLAKRGAELEVVDINTPPETFTKALATADIIISGAGSAGLIKPGMIKEGVVLIDAGTSEQGGVVVGDADPACAEKCAIFTPVPGGVGPIAVAKLFENAVELASRAK
jgi:methylenetetrahydrofolate dehydrogenase (NADP+)/methenyltetrahydrofolate cyclohydrolase